MGPMAKKAHFLKLNGVRSERELKQIQAHGLDLPINKIEQVAVSFPLPVPVKIDSAQCSYCKQGPLQGPALIDYPLHQKKRLGRHIRRLKTGQQRMGVVLFRAA